MHRIAIPPHIVARAVARRGRLHPFEDIVPARTAHLVVDMQNGFLAPGEQTEVPEARDIVDNINRISRALREAGGFVIFLQYAIDAGTLAAWPNRFAYFSTPTVRARSEAAFAPGSFGHQLWPGLDIAAQDLAIRKDCYSAFVPGASSLHATLQAVGIDTLIISGTTTNTCCESTARDASMMDYKVIFVSDGTATQSDEQHNATLCNMLLNFTDVMTTNETIACVERAKGERGYLASSKGY